MPQPALIFVPGAWHSPDAFDEVIALLAAKGFTSHKIYTPSVGNSPPVSSIQPDVEAIRAVALAEMQKGQNVTVVCHSYGGVPTSAALKGLDKPQSTGGGRVSAIIYIAAMLIPEGVTVSAAFANHVGSPPKAPFNLLDDGNLQLKNDHEIAEVFYGDLTPQDAQYWVSQLKPHSGATFDSPANHVAWKDIPSWYLVAKQDNIVSPEFQRALIQEAREYLDQTEGPGAGEQKLKYEEFDSSHSPFLSRPKETADFIEKAAMAYSD